VSSGRYQSASEVVRTALRLLEEHEQQKTATLEWLAQEIRKGIDSGGCQPGPPGILRKIHQKTTSPPSRQSISSIKRLPYALLRHNGTVPPAGETPATYHARRQPGGNHCPGMGGRLSTYPSPRSAASVPHSGTPAEKVGAMGGGGREA